MLILTKVTSGISKRAHARARRWLSLQWLLIMLILTGLIYGNSRTPVLAGAKAAGTIKAVSPTVPIIRKVFDNGLILLIKPNLSNDVVSVNAYIRMGGIYEPQNQRGLSKLMQQVLLKGTATRNAKEIVFETETAGASIDAGLVDSGYGNVSLKTTLTGLERSLPVFLDILQNPAFPYQEFAKEKQLMLQQLATANDQPATEAYLNFRRLFYGDHPVGAKPEEIAGMVKTLTRDDLTAWYQKTYVPNNIVISIVGNVDPPRLEKTFQEALGKWPKGKALAMTASTAAPVADDRQLIKTRDSNALFLVFGYPAPEITSDDSPAMSLISYILGGDMGSRLFTELRDKKGLAYDVSTGYYPSNYPANVYAFMAMAPGSYQAARDGIIAEFKRITTEPVPAAELQAAKQALKGSFLIGHETNAGQAGYIGGFELLGLGYRYDQSYPELIDKVTAADLRRVAQKYFGHYVLSVLTPDIKETD